MSNRKLVLSTTAIWLIVAVSYGLTFFVKGSGFVLGYFITGCIVDISFTILWKEIYEWLENDKVDTE